MKWKILLTANMMLLSSYALMAQCTITGLIGNYCASDTILDTFSVSCNGNPGTATGPGVNTQGSFFSPSAAGPGTHVIALNGDPDDYTVDQTGVFSPEPGTGTSVSLGDDAVQGNLPIGFTFNFFGNGYSQFGISSNGFIYFGGNTDNGCCSGDFIPGAGTPNNIVAFAWEDLDPDGVGTIEYFTIGTAPNRKLIMNFIGIPHFPGPGPNANVTSQVQLWEGCGRIEIHTTTQPDGSGLHTQGIENDLGTIAYATPGRNSSTWTATNDMVAFYPTNCTTTTIVVDSGPSISSIVADTLDCFNDSNATATITASGAGTLSYLWSNGQTTATATNLFPGTYTCSVTDGSTGCASDASVQVVAPLPIGASFNTNSASCESTADGSLQLIPTGGTSPYSFQWNDPNSSTTATVNGLVAGNYSVTITDASGCEFETGAMVGFDNEDPEVDLGDQITICPGKSQVLVGPASGNPPTSTYNWSTGESSLSIIVSTPGTYGLTVTDQNGCIGSDEVTIDQFSPVQVNLGPNVNGPGPIEVDAGDQFVNYTWSVGVPPVNTQILTVTTSGNYSVTVTDSNGCQSSDTIKVSIWPNAVSEIEDASLRIYPNPASDQLFLQSDITLNAAEIIIFDISGKQVKSVRDNISAGIEFGIPINDLASGNYIVKIKSDAVETELRLTVE